MQSTIVMTSKNTTIVVTQDYHSISKFWIERCASSTKHSFVVLIFLLWVIMTYIPTTFLTILKKRLCMLSLNIMASWRLRKFECFIVNFSFNLNNFRKVIWYDVGKFGTVSRQFQPFFCPNQELLFVKKERRSMIITLRMITS